MTSNDPIMKQQKRLAKSFMQENSYYRKEPFKKKGRQLQTLADVTANNRKDRTQATKKNSKAAHQYQHCRRLTYAIEYNTKNQNVLV